MAWASYMKAPALSAGTWEIEKGDGNKKLETQECRLRPSEKNAIRPAAAVKTESQIGTIDLLEPNENTDFPSLYHSFWVFAR